MSDIINITLHVFNLLLSAIVPPLSSFIQKISMSRCLGCDMVRETTQESLILNEVRDIKMLVLNHQNMIDSKIDKLMIESLKSGDVVESQT